MKSMTDAIELILSFDRELYQIIGLSLYVSLISTFIASAIATVLGILIGLKDFRYKKSLVRLLYTTMSTPSVIIGLLIFLAFSRRSALGFLGFSYTPAAMIIAQTLLVMPLITGIIVNGTKEKGREIVALGRTLGGSRIDILILLIREMKIIIFTGIVAGFGRAISEVGAVMIVGGNIKGYTRTMTTTIAMLQNMGEYDMAIALGTVLLLLSFLVNSLLYTYQQGEDL